MERPEVDKSGEEALRSWSRPLTLGCLLLVCGHAATCLRLFLWEGAASFEHAGPWLRLLGASALLLGLLGLAHARAKTAASFSLRLSALLWAGVLGLQIARLIQDLSPELALQLGILSKLMHGGALVGLAHAVCLMLTPRRHALLSWIWRLLRVLFLLRVCLDGTVMLVALVRGVTWVEVVGEFLVLLPDWGGSLFAVADTVAYPPLCLWIALQLTTARLRQLSH